MAFKLLDRARMAVSGAPGTGNIALGAAVTGYQSFSQAGISNGDSFPYALVDGNNWEYGVATYASSGNQLTRTVTKTSAQNSTPLNLSSHTVISGVLRAEDVAATGPGSLVGLTDVNMTPSVLTDGYSVTWDNGTGRFILSAAGGGAQRTLLSSSITLYVATTGNDTTGDGSVGAPWATIQHAADYAAKNVDGAGQYGVTISVGSGSFVGVSVPTFVGLAHFSIQGAGSGSTTLTPNLVFGNCIGIFLLPGCPVLINKMTLDFSAGSDPALSIASGGFSVTFSDPTNSDDADLVFKGGNSTGRAMQVVGAVQVYAWSGTMTIDRTGYTSASIGQEFLLQKTDVAEFDCDLVINGSPTYTVGLIELSYAGLFLSGAITASGTVTGRKFSVEAGSQLATANTIPGSLAGFQDNVSGFNGAFPKGTLVGLSDVSITTGAGVDGYSVVWNNGASKFELSNVSGGGGSSLAVLNNGSSVDTAAVSLNFVNATNVTTSSHAVTVTLPTGGGGGSTETPPVSTNFTAVTHLNSATLTDRSSGAIPSLHVLPGSGDSDGDLYCALQAAPVGTFSIVVGVRHALIGSNSGWKGAGPVIHNSAGTLSSYVWLTPTYSPAIWVGTFSGGFTSGTPSVGTTLNGGDYYLHIDYDGTNVKYGLSHNGVDKVWASTVTLASFMGAITHVGIGWSGAFISMEHDFFHWHIGALGTSGL